MRTAIFFLLVTLGLTAWGQKENGIIEVSGTATMEVKPDYIDVRVVVEQQADNAELVQEHVMNQSREIISYLKGREGIEKIQTDMVSLYPRKNHQTDEVSYSGRQMLSFRITRIDLYEEVIPGLLQRGVNGISRLTYGSSSIQEVRTELRLQALRNALEKARMMAAVLDREIGEAVYISDQMPAAGPYPLRAAGEMKLSSEQPSIEAGIMEISEQVRVHFQLK